MVRRAAPDAAHAALAAFRVVAPAPHRIGPAGASGASYTAAMSNTVTLPVGLSRLQRWVLGRSIARYTRLPAELRPVAIERDAFLLSPRASGLWVGLVCGIAGTTYGFATDPDPLPMWLALLFAVTNFVGLFKAGMSAWLRPHRFRGRRLLRVFLIVLVATYAAAIASFGGRLDGLVEQGMSWHEALMLVARRATPLQFVAFAGVLVLLAAVAAARRQLLERELARARAEQERDAVLRQATQARLRLLQAQIQPHFLFNTLAALQHWVDVGDARAAPLLRALTSFLRGSTEHMLVARVTLAQECEVLRHYLEIMSARLGERLRYRIDLSKDCAMLTLPPGILITLVENAIEHGIEPALRGGELRVQVRRRDDCCEAQVLDNGIGLAADASDGVGITNTRERLRHAFGEGALLRLQARDDSHGTQALARWPVDTVPPV